MLLSEAEGNKANDANASYLLTSRGRRPYACINVFHTEPGRSYLVSVSTADRLRKVISHELNMYANRKSDKGIVLKKP